MALRNASLTVALTFVAQLGVPVSATAAADSGPVVCTGTKAIRDTVGIVTDRKTGAREQSLVEARLAVVSRGSVIGTVYVDDQGLRYIEVKPGVAIPGLANAHRDGAVRPLGMQQSFDGEARLRACKPEAR